MRKIKNILVALDLTTLDQKIVAYTSDFATKIGAEKVYFVHNIKKFAFSDLFKEQLSEIDLEEIIEKKINQEVEQYFKSDIATEIFISEDDDTVSLLRYVTGKFGIDLLVLGNKNYNFGTGVVSSKILHALRCDLLLVNENAPKFDGKILTSTDFSKSSVAAMLRAKNINQELGLRNKVECLHVYKIPQIYFPFLEKKETIAKVEKHTKEKFNKFIQKNNLSDVIEPIVLSAGDATIVKKIKETAKEKNADLIMISSRGQNSFNALLTGSVTESLFTGKSTRPIMVIRD